MEIAQNLKKIKQELGHNTKLLAVSKTKPIELIVEALECGQIHFGENKIQELLQKSNDIQNPDIKWHLIGPIQTNKINKVLEINNLYAIHSIDRIKVLKQLVEKGLNPNVNLFLQVNTSGETEKSGVSSFEELCELVDFLKGHDRIESLAGLMCIGARPGDNFETSSKQSFQKIVEFKQMLENTYSLQELELSMGMSADYH